MLFETAENPIKNEVNRPMILSGTRFEIAGNPSRSFPLPPLQQGLTAQQGSLFVTNLSTTSSVFVNVYSNAAVIATAGDTEVSPGATVTVTLTPGIMFFALLSGGPDPAPCGIGVGN